MTRADLNQFKRQVEACSDLEFLRELADALDYPASGSKLSPAVTLVANHIADIMMVEINAAVEKGDLDLELLRRIAHYFNQRTAAILLQKMACLKIHNCVESFCQSMARAVESLGGERAFSMLSESLAT